MIKTIFLILNIIGILLTIGASISNIKQDKTNLKNTGITILLLLLFIENMVVVQLLL